MATDSGRGNNFDALRCLAALAVIFSHAFLVAEGSEGNEWFVRLTGGQAVLGLVGVFVFFVMSGYLVTGSYLSTGSPMLFVLKRLARILPGYWVNLILTGLLLGAILTVLPPRSYLGDAGLCRFFGNNLAFEAVDTPLPGVVFSDNSVGRIVNGSLWTLRYELIMYGMVLGLGLMRLLRLWVSLVLVVLGMVSIAFETALTPYGDLGEWAWLVGFFAAGMAMRFLGPAWLDWRLAILAVLGLLATAALHRLILFFPLFGGYLTIYLALAHSPRLDLLRARGDLSYGLYIYGWPIEQAVVWAGAGHLTWWQVFLAATGIAVPVALLSWYAIEKRALALVHRLSPRGPRGRGRPARP